MTYRILVTGSRDWPYTWLIAHALEYTINEAFTHRVINGKYDIVIVHGACPSGADQIADEWAVRNGYPVERYLADWGHYGASAGPRRNNEMVARGADVCLAFNYNASKGTKQCARKAEEAGIHTVHIDISETIE